MSIDKRIIRWNTWHAFLMIVGGLSFAFASPVIWAILVLFSFFNLGRLQWTELKGLKKGLGPGNWLTALRLVGFVALSMLHSKIDPLVLGLLAYAFIALDGLDGWLARKTETTSEFGAWFDMETDAYYVALFSSLLVIDGTVSWWVIIPGFMRYIYSLGLQLFQVAEKQEKRSRWGRYIAGFMFIALPLPLILEKPFGEYVVYVASGAILLSFARSIYFLIKS